MGAQLAWDLLGHVIYSPRPLAAGWQHPHFEAELLLLFLSHGLWHTVPDCNQQRSQVYSSRARRAWPHALCRVRFQELLLILLEKHHEKSRDSQIVQFLTISKKENFLLLVSRSELCSKLQGWKCFPRVFIVVQALTL